MKHTAARATLLCLALLVILTLAAAPAGAIVGGIRDDDNVYFNVGMPLQWGSFVPGEWGFSGSCTLVSNQPGNVVVLCAAHQLIGWDATDNCVTFEPRPNFGWVWTDSEGIGIGGARTYAVIAQAIHPDAAAYVASGSWSKRKSIGPGHEDIALMWLAEQVYMPDGTTLMPARPIIGRHGLDALDLKSETFTAVGYGTTGWVQGNPASLWAGGAGLAMWDGRQYIELSLKTEKGPFSDRYLQLTAGQNGGDSGGPLLHDGVLVAVDSFGQTREASGDYNYRLDTQSAQDFITYWLTHGPPE